MATSSCIQAPVEERVDEPLLGADPVSLYDSIWDVASITLGTEASSEPSPAMADFMAVEVCTLCAKYGFMRCNEERAFDCELIRAARGAVTRKKQGV